MKAISVSAALFTGLFGVVSSVSAQAVAEAGRGVPSSYSSYSAEIQADGNLRGTLQLIDTQLPVPGVVQITFIRNGRLVAKSTADEQGVFQAQGLVPGTYSVVATANRRFAAFSLTVLPHQLRQGATEMKQAGFAKANQVEFTVPLTAASDFQLISQVVQQETPPETPPTTEGTPPTTVPLGGGGGGGVGGGGGGAGGLAAVLAATAGAVGLGVGLSDDDNTPASPSTP